MTTWDRICRICSSPAEYEVFANIPTYLHANANEFQHWQKPLNVLIEATTGLKVTRGDGLPPSICALCISYLKHAVAFREQAVSNALSLTAVKLLRQKARRPPSEKDALLITAESLNYAPERQEDTNELLNNFATDQQNKVNKPMLINNFQPVSAPTQSDVDNQMRYLNLLFDKDPNTGLHSRFRNNVAAAFDAVEPNAEAETRTPTPTTSSDDNETAKGAIKKQNLFTYREKNFEEDDIMEMDGMRNSFHVELPESWKERKCRACFRRFMFAGSFTDHMDTCIEYQFVTFIEELNRYLEIRRSKAISPHEFIRRMIFCLRKTCEWLRQNCADVLMPDLLANGSNGVSDPDIAAKQPPDSEDKSSTASSLEQREEQKPEPIVALRERLHKQVQQQKMTDFKIQELLQFHKQQQQQKITDCKTQEFLQLQRLQQEQQMTDCKTQELLQFQKQQQQQHQMTDCKTQELLQFQKQQQKQQMTDCKTQELLQFQKQQQQQHQMTDCKTQELLQFQKQQQKQQMTDCQTQELLQFQKQQQQQEKMPVCTLPELLELRKLHQQKKMADLQVNCKTQQQHKPTNNHNLDDLNLENSLKNLLKLTIASQPPQQQQTQTPVRNSGTATPISISNNILYEIERAQSRNSSYAQNGDYEAAGGSNSQKPHVQPPIVDLATTSAAAAAAAATQISTAPKSGKKDIRFAKWNLLQRMELADPDTAAKSQEQQIFPTPPSAMMVREGQSSVAASASAPLTLATGPAILNFSARCNPCNKVFDALDALEVHNAMYHNNTALSKNNNIVQQRNLDLIANAERKRIIALFED